MEETAQRVKAAKDEAPQRRAASSTSIRSACVTCRPTQKEAEEYYRYAIIEKGDWSAVDGILAQEEHLGRHRGPGGIPAPAPWLRQRHGRAADGRRPDRIAQILADLSHAGVRGIGFSFVNYLKELPFFCDEVLPRLERMGVRAKRK